jgi:hypothetical protein
MMAAFNTSLNVVGDCQEDHRCGSLCFDARPQGNLMSDEQSKSEQTAELDQTELAHSIIESLLEHTTVVSDLIALMAQALDPDTTKALTLTPQWQAYLESRRRMERTQTDVQRFVETVKASGQSSQDD